MISSKNLDEIIPPTLLSKIEGIFSAFRAKKISLTMTSGLSVYANQDE